MLLGTVRGEALVLEKLPLSRDGRRSKSALFIRNTHQLPCCNTSTIGIVFDEITSKFNRSYEDFVASIITIRLGDHIPTSIRAHSGFVLIPLGRFIMVLLII